MWQSEFSAISLSESFTDDGSAGITKRRLHDVSKGQCGQIKMFCPQINISQGLKLEYLTQKGQQMDLTRNSPIQFLTNI